MFVTRDLTVAAAWIGLALALAPRASGQDLYPTLASAGTPPGWTPTRSITGDYWVRSAGAIVEDLRITDGNLMIGAPNVTVRRVEIRGGRIDNVPGDRCNNGLVIEDTTITRSARQTRDTDPPVIGIGGYTARNVKIDNVPEGFRVGGRSNDCGPVVIENSYVRIVPPDICQDWHGDGIQGYDGPPVMVRNVVLKLVETRACGGTAPFFYPDAQGNSSVDINRMMVEGGGYPFRLGMTGSVRDLKIVNESWGYGPIDVKCTLVPTWSAKIVSIDADGQPVDLRAQTCSTG
ncbi:MULTISPECIES: hypothetical protein [unclassified Sinorhizobium]|uniref:hypothetical protein n=1 Tax=unclassified Sinorhizobium TaxID=2613772 RepID=UPI0024C43850|nr:MULTISPECIES: hypothetical protein [unclassified Sinorhizobium]MDK1374015.1 hypothetical protein [Sinorhizobium sp. 6-70]MDK1477428.1 hypothetical protein [Sinorhizobium sp. 6-117]